jgi:ribosomal protein S18 acetylase RimI-like enzyme
MYSIRAATKEDEPAVSKICLLTAAAGKDASELYSYHEIPGKYFADPYLHLPGAFGFILVDDLNAPAGYVLGASDTIRFEAEMDRSWLAPLRDKYPLEPGEHETRKKLDSFMIDKFHHPWKTNQHVLSLSPAHIHIDILPQAQRKGYGRSLIAAAVKHLQTQCGCDALWVGLDPKNEEAKKFYMKIGFRRVDDAPEGEFMLLRFQDFSPSV